MRFPQSALRGIAQGLACYYLTTCVAFAGLLLSDNLETVHPRHAADPLTRTATRDGDYYLRIAASGYWYRPDTSCPVAFWPAYPLLGRWLAAATGMPLLLALLAVTHASLAGAMAALACYAQRRLPSVPPNVTDWSLWAFGLWPTTMFFRMAYAEALFVLLVALLLCGIARRWPPLVLAALCGAATATRPVGVALVPVLLLYTWRHYAGTLRPKWLRAARCLAITCLSCWGIVAFMAYQWQAFGDPLAAARTQAYWRLRDGDDVPVWRKAVAEATLQPIWESYVPSSANYWARLDPGTGAIVSLQFADPIFFVATATLVIIGWRKRWLNDYELLLAAGLLLVPYVTKSYDNAMGSFGRFSAVVLPAYLVMGRLLAAAPKAVAVAILAVCAALLAVYSARFAAGYRLV